MPLTEQDKVKIRHHLGYSSVTNAFVFALGYPSSAETRFMIEGAMDRVQEAAIPELRRILQIMDGIEEQGVADHELLAVTAVGEISVRGDEHGALDAQYSKWAGALCNMLGIERNPNDQRRGVWMNVPVMH